MPAAKVFLSNIFLNIFAFSIANVETIVVNMLNWLQVPIFAFFSYKNCNIVAAVASVFASISIFAFLLIKNITRKQELQVYQANCRYLFLLFWLQKL